MVTAAGTAPRPGERCGDPYGPVYRKLRRRVLARNGGDCSLCGLSAAVETHHSGLEFPPVAGGLVVVGAGLGWGIWWVCVGFAISWLPRCVGLSGLGAACSSFRPGLWRWLPDAVQDQDSGGYPGHL